MKHPFCSIGQSPFRGSFLWAAASSIVWVTLIVHCASVSASDEQPKASDASQASVYSGLQAGEKLKPFDVLHIKDGQLKELEVVKEGEEETTLICFVHRLSNDDRILFGLGLVDFYAAKHLDLTSHFVLLSDEREKIKTMLRGWERGALFPKSLVSLSADGAEGPGYYGLNRNVAMTVLVAKENKVLTNLVFNAPNYRDLESIMVAVAKALGEPEPQLADVQQELRAERQRKAEERMKSSPVFKLAPNAELGRIMYGMVNARGNRSQNALRRSQQLLDWAGDSEERKSELRQYCKAILSGNFQLNQYSQAALQKIAAD